MKTFLKKMLAGTVRFCQILSVAAFLTSFMALEAKAQWTTSGSDITNSNSGAVNIGTGASNTGTSSSPTSFVLGTATKPLWQKIYSTNGGTGGQGYGYNFPGLQLLGMGTFSGQSLSMGVREDPWIGNSYQSCCTSPAPGAELKVRFTSLLKVQPWLDYYNLLDVNNASNTNLFHIDKDKSTFMNNVGIGTATPAYKLDIAGTASMTGFKLGSSTSAGYVLTTDVNGNGTWQAAGASSGAFTFSGNNIFNNNTGNVGFGNPTPNYKVDITGTAAMTGFKLGSSAIAGYVLTTDVNGNGSWQPTGNGPWTFSGTNLYPNITGNIGIGNSSPAYKLDVTGTAAVTALKVGSSTTAGYVLTASDALGNANWQAAPVSSQWVTNGTAIYSNANVAIGRSTVPSGYIAAFEGKIRTRGVRCDQDIWADDAFSKNYFLMSMDSLSQFINQYSHLPGIPTTEEVKKNGVDMAVMNEQLLRKIEENTLYLLQLKVENDALKNEIKEIQALIKKN
jgi:hypothetical protein